MLQLATNNELVIDGKFTGLGLTQRREGSVVYTMERAGRVYAEHPMPHKRYAASHDKPVSGAAGRSQLEADVRELMGRLG